MEFGELIFLIIMIAFASYSKQKKKQKKQQATISPKAAIQSAVETIGEYAEKELGLDEEKKPKTFSKPVKLNAASPAAARVMTSPAAAVTKPKEGSIAMPPDKAHEHEGKPMPCPAVEREKPRLRDDEQLVPVNEKKGLQLALTKDSLVQAAIMSEVLNRPRFVNGRRVIR